LKKNSERPKRRSATAELCMKMAILVSGFVTGKTPRINSKRDAYKRNSGGISGGSIGRKRTKERKVPRMPDPRLDGASHGKERTPTAKR